MNALEELSEEAQEEQDEAGVNRLEFLYRRMEHDLSSWEATGFSGSKDYVDAYTYDFLKTYLYSLYKGALKNPGIKVLSFNTVHSYSNPVFCRPVIIMEDSSGRARIENDIVHVQINFRGKNYYVYLNRHRGPDRSEDGATFHEAGVYSYIDRDTDVKMVFEELQKESLVNSIYKGEILRVLPAPYVEEETLDLLRVQIVKEEEKTCLNDIFLPEEIRRDIARFVECVERYDELKIPVKYLMSGPPGTAKTMITRAITSACRGKATILLAGGNSFRTDMIFNFASLFKPCIICVDDIDLCVGDRRHSQSFVLNSFLQRMDGFIKNDIFVLATTNDKRLVDIAASRPGRFDLILDVAALGPDNYMSLVKSRTSDASIVKLFTPAIMAELKDKRVVGAFIANLVKQITILKHTNGTGDVTERDLGKMINKIHAGFYAEPGRAKLGFGQGEV
jgi:AAA+ superfamily predicted ATPase